MTYTSQPAYVGDVEHDLQMVRMWTASARRAAEEWMTGRARTRAAQRSIDEALTELRRVCIELEKLDQVEVSICVWEAILVVVHLRDCLGVEDKVIVQAANELLGNRERAIGRTIDDVKPAVIYDLRPAAAA